METPPSQDQLQLDIATAGASAAPSPAAPPASATPSAAAPSAAAPPASAARSVAGAPSQGQDSLATTLQKPKVRRAITPRSAVWVQFDKFETEDGEPKGKCKFCAAEIGCHSKIHGTAALKNHMKNCKEVPHTSDPRQTEIDSVNDCWSKV